MRIVHITDLHYASIESEYDFNTLFEALLENLLEEQKEKSIDLVLITGDLIDKGGKFFGDGRHYNIVQDKVIDPIVQRLKLSKNQILIIPGNHDVCEKNDKDHYYLKGLRSGIDIPAVNRLIDQNYQQWVNPEVDGVKLFKEFEKHFYKDAGDANFEVHHSNFETGFIYKFGDARIGIAAFNSAWGCATALDKSEKYKLPFGTGQILRINKLFHNKTDFNIALLHHPINAGIYNEQEEKEMKVHLSRGNFNMLFCGHTHESKDNFIKESDASYYLIVTKASLNNPRILQEQYKSGFSLIDLTYHSEDEITVTRHFRKYFSPKGFGFDTDDSVRAQSSLQIKLNHSSRRFTRYLKSSHSTTFDPERKALIDTINSFSQNYIKSPFPEIFGDALKSSFERFLPVDFEFNYFRENLVIRWEIAFHDDKYYHFNEEQSFLIKSSKEPFDLEHSIFVDKVLNDKDKTSIKFTEFSIDGEDRHKDFVSSRKALPREGAFGMERQTLTLITKLNGKEQYEIKSRFEAINSLASKKAWTLRRRSIAKGYELIITNPDKRYHIEVFGIGTDTYYSNIDENGKMKDEIVVSKREDIMAPGMEFWLFVSSY